MQNQGTVSCQHVRWLFDLCRQRQIPERHLLNHVGLDAETLNHADTLIDWESMALIYANLGSWISDDDLLQAASVAWKHDDFRYWRIQASLYVEPSEQITSLLFDPAGILASLPIRARIARSSADSILIDLLTESLVPPPSALSNAIAGQLASVPAALGNDAAEANVIAADTLTRLEFWLPATSRLAHLRRAVSLPLNALFLARHARRVSQKLIEAERESMTIRQARDEAEQHADGAEIARHQLEGEIEEERLGRERAEKETREVRRRLQTLVSNISEAIIRTDRDGIIIDFNEATLDIFGQDDGSLLGAPITALIPQAQIVPTESRGLAIEGRGPTGELQLHARVFRSQTESRTWVIRDITEMTEAERERAALQHQLHATQRVESIGELTGGIAHDFNNLLVAINGYAELCLGQPDLDRMVRGHLQEIRRAGDRAADMTQKLLTFARRQEIEFVEVDLNELIKGVENMIRRLLPANISVRFLQSLQSPHVLADAGQLEQVVVNLCVNARDAMSKGRESKGRESKGRESDSDRLTITVGEKSGVDDDGEFREYALISIEDTGAGIPSSVVDKIFEPFFTTKDEGEGTGLGLSVVYGIIKRHGGTIDVDSEPGRGTRFEVQLPLIDPVRTQVLDIPAKSTEPDTRSSLSHTAGILLVEDNDQVRRLCEQVLSGCGYEMFTAVNGQDGIEVFEENADNIDLVIVDLVMPKRGGRDVFEAIRTVKPSTRVLFSTGYASHSEQARFISEYGLEMIEKPYTPETLCRRVEALLDRDPAVGQ